MDIDAELRAAEKRLAERTNRRAAQYLHALKKDIQSDHSRWSLQLTLGMLGHHLVSEVVSACRFGQTTPSHVSYKVLMAAAMAARMRGVGYEDQMEGADWDDFRGCEFAASTMYLLSKQLAATAETVRLMNPKPIGI